MSATIRIAACDLNGQARGKRVPESYLEKLDKGAARMPLSALNVDLSGADIEASPLLFQTGDADGVLIPTGRGPVPMPWLASPSMLVPMGMTHDDGTPFEGCPRRALARVLERYAARGWTPIVATELEFYLVDDSGAAPLPPAPPGRTARLDGDGILSLATLDAFDALFSDLYAGAEAMGIPAQAAIAESGVSQFEVNLSHQDAMRAADDAWLFRMLVKGMARKHGMAATFMAKPFPEAAGTGLHLHVSLVDSAGRNVFDNGGAKGNDALRSAVAGCLAALPASTLVFAPHASSYDRFVDDSHAPTTAAWGYENRTAALRIPGGDPQARRFEHRVAGGDTNPYLLIAAVLGAALAGIEDGLAPPPPVTGNAYAEDLPRLAPDLPAAVEAFKTSPWTPRLFHADLTRNLILTKRQEITRFGDLTGTDRTRLYLETV